MKQNPKDAKENLMLTAFDFNELEFDLRGGCTGTIIREGQVLTLYVTAQVADGEDDEEICDKINVKINSKK